MILLGWLACVDPGASAPIVALPEADLAVFAAEIQPILGETCASGSCHGDASAPMALYAPGRRRADPLDLWTDAPLTDAELGANALAAVLAADPLDPRLISRPLAEEAGGTWHGGGVQYEDRSEPDWQALDGWAAEVWR